MYFFGVLQKYESDVEIFVLGDLKSKRMDSNGENEEALMRHFYKTIYQRRKARMIQDDSLKRKYIIGIKDGKRNDNQALPMKWFLEKLNSQSPEILKKIEDDESIKGEFEIFTTQNKRLSFRLLKEENPTCIWKRKMYLKHLLEKWINEDPAFRAFIQGEELFQTKLIIKGVIQKQ
jgi:hypothetical protein